MGFGFHMSNTQQTESTSITNFRHSLTTLCRSVRVNNRDVIVRDYGKPIFRLTKLIDGQFSTVSFTQARDFTSDFLDLLEMEGTVTLTSRGKPKATCIKL
jgi:PHD/YefM family antitoxin component YafN of YafNO toxin-antitoxin module